MGLTGKDIRIHIPLAVGSSVVTKDTAHLYSSVMHFTREMLEIVVLEAYNYKLN